ncbi:KpsF/GutQ family sugar-phosphate isomerase [bacterium]|nr:KpsF/GutQ family sugar-phosphate isomerase [bacterium]
MSCQPPQRYVTARSAAREPIRAYNPGVELPELDYQALGRAVLEHEAAALHGLAQKLDGAFSQACAMLKECRGRVIVSGMGKSGHVGRKIAASLSSIGVASHFLHPGESAHGDLGVLRDEDVVLALSASGETSEILDILPTAKSLGARLIGVTARPDSTLARMADCALLIGDFREADPYNLVPTTSTTLMLALGDAMVVALMQAKDVTPERFAVLHPKGMLGKRLTLQVADLLAGDSTNPRVPVDAPFGSAIEVITSFTLGGTCVVDPDGGLAGILTDGDVRRILNRYASEQLSLQELLHKPVSELMTAQPKRVEGSRLAYEVLGLMENNKPRPIFVMPVVDEAGRPIGLLHLHALVQAGFKPSLQDA